MDENMNVTEQDQLDTEQLNSEQDADVYDEDEDGVYSTEIEDDEDPYELSDEELAELADEEDDDPEEEFSDDNEDAEDGEAADENDEEDGTSRAPSPTGENAEPSGEVAADGNGDGVAEPTEASEDENAEQGSEQQGAAVDYASMATADIAELGRLYPSLGITDLRQIDDPGRYGALREMGLSVKEAFLATNADRVHAHSSGTTVHRADGKAHIRGDMPAKGASAADGFTLSASQMRDARELFPGMSDKEIIALYKSVSK